MPQRKFVQPPREIPFPKRLATRRETLGKHLKGGRRGGELKIDWTKPLPRAWPMCIVCRVDLWQGLKEPEAVSVRG